MTALDYLVNRIKVLIPEDIGSQLMFKSNVNKAKVAEVREMALLLRWLLKHYSTKTDSGFVGWVDSQDREVTIDKIINHYKESQAHD